MGLGRMSVAAAWMCVSGLVALAGVAEARSSVAAFIPEISKSGLAVQGDAAPNSILIAVERADEGEQYVVEESGGIHPYGDCISESPVVVRCALFGGVDAHALDGDDSIRVDAPYPARLYGGDGDDRLIGGTSGDKLRGNRHRDLLRGRAGHDRLFGGAGPDRLFGGPGNDKLVGGTGRDVLRGGAGNDRLRADDGQRDRVIDCGPGKRDIAFIDRGLDPDPIGCERIRFGSPR